MNFIINLYKPKNLSSVQASNLLKKQWNVKKIGHLGTLDPLAKGVLPIFSGKHTKLIPYFQDLSKTYKANIELGVSSDTLDAEGKLTYKPASKFSLLKIKQIVKSFEGAIKQKAPDYSALKYKGKPYYYYALRNIEIPSNSRQVEIYYIELIKYNHPIIEITVKCSKGTYIRVLASDIGEKLGSCAILRGLERINIGDKFTTKNSITLDQIKNQPYSNSYGLDPKSLLTNFGFLIFTDKQINEVITGRQIEIKEIGCKFNNEQEIFSFSQNEDIIASGLIIKMNNKIIFQPKKLLI